MYADAHYATKEFSMPAFTPEQTSPSSAPASTHSHSMSPHDVQTRFGKVHIDPSKAIRFAAGLVGMPDKHSFCLASFPSEKMARFKLLQATEEADLSFITLPLDADNDFISADDIDHACEHLSIDRDDVALLLIVSVHRSVKGVRLSVNCVAPIFIDTRNNVAAQFVYGHGKYQVRHML